MYRLPFTDEGQIWCGITNPGYTLACQISSNRLDRFILSPSVGENPQFLPVFGLRHLVLSPVCNSLRKLNMGAQLQTFPYQTASKLFLYSSAFMAKSGAQSLMFKSVTNKQTDTKKLNIFVHPSGGWNPSPTKLGTVIEDLEHILALPKIFQVWRIVLPLGALKIWGNPTLNLEPPNSVTPWANPSKF